MPKQFKDDKSVRVQDEPFSFSEFRKRKKDPIADARLKSLLTQIKGSKIEETKRKSRMKAKKVLKKP
jgi:hypothetical protein